MAARYWLILTLIGAAFGASFAFNEMLLDTYGPLTVSTLRIGVGATGCWIWVMATGRSLRIPGHAIPKLIVFGVFQFAAPFALLPLAQGHITSSVAGIANALAPVAVVIISHFWPGGERATPTKVLGVALGVVGITVLTMRGSEIGASAPVFVLVAALAPVCYAIALNMVRWFKGIDPIVVISWAMICGASAIAPIAIAVEGIPAVPNGGAVAALAIVGVGLTSVTFLAMYSLLPAIGATNLSLVTFVAPVSATMIGFFVFSEAIGSGHLVGMAFILCGLVAIDGRALRTIIKTSRMALMPAELRIRRV